MIAYACSPACAENQWKEGPGPNLDTPQMRATLSLRERYRREMLRELAPALGLIEGATEADLFARAVELMDLRQGDPCELLRRALDKLEGR